MQPSNGSASCVVAGQDTAFSCIFAPALRPDDGVQFPVEGLIDVAE
jgi:hypothetical protein